MSQHMSKIVIGIFCSTIASACFADPQSIQGSSVQITKDYYVGQAGGEPSGWGRHVSSATISGGMGTYTSLGDALQQFQTTSQNANANAKQ